jgi:Dolichyl-phosphate-mannose-protein mannosyltransferase
VTTCTQRGQVQSRACTRLDLTPPVAWAVVVVVVVAKLAITLPFLDRYGWHRDELYLLASAKHLQGAYVDFPAVTPLIGRAVVELFGPSLYALRFSALVASCAALVLCALIARELGGGRTAQLVALVAFAFCPLALGEPTLFQPNSFDLLLWAAILFVTTRLLRTEDVRLFPWLGVLAGLALATKWTSAWLLAGLVLAALFSPRARAFARTPWPYVALAIAAVFVIPTVVWESRHGWPTLEFASNQNADTRADESRPEFLLNLLLRTGILAAPLWIAGLVRLWRDPRYRPIAGAAVFVVVAFCAGGGRSYYPFPVFVALFAAGGVAVEAAAARHRALVPLALAAGLAGLLALPIAIPVVPRDKLADTPVPDIRDDFGDETGWPELTDQVAAIARADGATAILASNYGEAGALDHFGPRDLPPVASGHLTYQYWRPATRPGPLVTVGYGPAQLAGLCRSFAVRGHVREIDGLENEEVGTPIATCVPRAPLARMWDRIASLG